MAVRPNLLLCFDAFGTLFRPKRPVAQQYGDVARQCGIVGFGDNELKGSLLAAMKAESERNPNYGKATGLGATRWWTNVIHNTFTPLLKKDQPMPADLAPKLLHRFASNEGYDAEANLASSLKSLKGKNTHSLFAKIVAGVITNSDDRVPDVISSFGINVSPLRYGTAAQSAPLAGQDFDIDFHCISYDVGVEKPDKLIFNAAELILTQIIGAREGKSPAETQADIETWQKVYVGDEYAKDVDGALNAGWNPVLLDKDDTHDEIPRLEGSDAGTLVDLFQTRSVVRVHSISDLARWLTRKI